MDNDYKTLYSIVIIRYRYHKLLFMFGKLEFRVGKSLSRSLVQKVYVEGNTELVLVTRLKSTNKMECLDVERWLILKLISKQQDRASGPDSFDSV